jgi:hypothetical protein
MRKISGFAFFLAILLSSTDLLAQTNPEADVDERYLIENVFGIVKATNGGFISGFYYRHSKKLSDKTLQNIAVEMVNIKHPREAKETTFIGSSFIYGKSNYLFSIRPTYGRERILFKKAPQQGARVTGILAVGPAIGLEVPYYIDLGNNQSEQYNPSNPQHARAFISGSAGPFAGLGEAKFVLGIHFKASLTFETNSTKNRVFGFEVGLTLDQYTREIQMLPLVENFSTFPAAFLAIYFGKRR